MSRPDAFYFSNTNQLSSLEFTPGRLIYNRIPKWISVLLVTQFAVGAAAWVALRAVPGRQWARALLGGGRYDRLADAVGSVDLANRFPGLTSVMSPQDAGALLSFVVVQLAVMLLVHLIALPLVRRTLKRHTGGLKDVFDAIRGLSSGIMPKPLAAGRPGEAGYLALAFNDMIARLMTSRKELLEANQTLERRVEQRTQELREAAGKLEKIALLDSLTGLANRRALMDDGERRLYRSAQQGDDLICLIIDLDNFKGVNDTMGHAKGDDLIRLAADTLRANCRPEDLSARLGGDEFVVIMAAESVKQIEPITQRLQAEFRRNAESLLRGFSIERMPSMSIGITSRKAAGATTLEELMKQADTALYQAKSLGKARAQVFLKPAA